MSGNFFPRHSLNGARHCQLTLPRKSFPAQPHMKKFVPYLITGAVAIVAVVFVWPLLKPFVAKIPVIGSYV